MAKTKTAETDKRQSSLLSIYQDKQFLGKLIIFCVFCGLILLMRMHTFNEPFERDITSHSVIGQELLNGRSLYSDLWDSKPPAIFITYALFNFIFSMGPLAVYMLGISMAILTMFGIYLAGEAIGSKQAGFWAAGIWTVLCSDLWLWANQPNIEVCINAGLVWAFVLIIKADDSKWQTIRWICVGLLFAAATLYKPVAITFAVFFALAFILSASGGIKGKVKAGLKVGIVAATGAAVWFAVFGYFAATGRFDVFYDTMIKYGGYYTESRGGSLWGNIIDGFSEKRFFAKPMESLWAPLILAVVGIIAGFFHSEKRKRILLLAFLIASPFAVALPGRFYPHYYQLWLVPVCIGFGWAIVSLLPAKSSTNNLVGILAGLICAGIVLSSVIPQYQYNADKWTTLKYGPQFVENKITAEFIGQILKPEEVLFVWGINPELYFWTKHSPPTGVIWSTDMLEGPLAQTHTERALSDLRKNPPAMFVINNRQLQIPQEHPVIRWALENYVPLPKGAQNGLFYILVKKDSELLTRMEN